MSKQTAKKCRDELQGLRADKRLRDIDLEHWTAKRSAQGCMGPEGEGLQSSFSRLGVG